MSSSVLLLAATSAVVAATLTPQQPSYPGAGAPVVINELSYNQRGADNDEFVELKNTTTRAIDIGGFRLEQRGVLGIITSHTIPAGTVLAPGGHYVIGSSNVPNVNLVVGTRSIWLDTQTDFTLYDPDGDGPGQDRVMDSVMVEAFNERTYAGMLGEGAGIWGTQGGYQGPGTTHHTFQRNSAGRDTGNNGNDFSYGPASPGEDNAATGDVTRAEFDFDSLAHGQPVPGWTGQYRVDAWDPGVVDPTRNPAPVPPSPGGGNVMSFGEIGTAGNQIRVDGTEARDVEADFCIYLSLDPLPENRVEYFACGVGHGDAGNTIPSRDRFPMAQQVTRCANVGPLLEIFREGGPNGVLSTWARLVSYEDGGLGHGPAPRYHRLMGEVDLPRGGWLHCSYKTCGNQVEATVDGLRMDGVATTARGPWSMISNSNISATSTQAAALRMFPIDSFRYRTKAPGVGPYGWPVPGADGRFAWLGVQGHPSVGNSGFAFRYGNGVPNDSAHCLIGLRRANPLHIPGTPQDFDLLVDPLTSISGPTDQNGDWNPSYPIPNVLDLTSVRIDVQGVQFDLKLPNPIPLVGPGAVSITIGVPWNTQNVTQPVSTPVPEEVHSRVAVPLYLPVPIEEDKGEVVSVKVEMPNDPTDPYTPNDFWVERSADGHIVFWAERAGIYFLEIQYDRPAQTCYLEVCAGGAAPTEGARQQPARRYERFTTPQYDVAAVERRQQGDNLAVCNAAAALPGEVRVATVDEAATAICNAFAALGRPVDVVLVGHGRPGRITLGKGQQPGTEFLDLSQVGQAGSKFELFVAKTKGKIRCLSLLSCRTGALLSGQSFLQKLDDGLTVAGVDVKVKGYDKALCTVPARIGRPAAIYVVEGATKVSSN